MEKVYDSSENIIDSGRNTVIRKNWCIILNIMLEKKKKKKKRINAQKRLVKEIIDTKKCKKKVEKNSVYLK